MKSLYRLLEHPLIYKTAGFLCAPGGQTCLRRFMRKHLNAVHRGGRILDVGCGPTSQLFQLEVYPVGIDLLLSYIVEYKKTIDGATVASADALPFRAACFDGVWSIGLLHHLPDSVARQTICEMLRVAKPGGYIAILDAVLPESSWRRPVASLIRRMDRGKHMRTENRLVSLLPKTNEWAIERRTYAATGLEILMMKCEKSNR